MCGSLGRFQTFRGGRWSSAYSLLYTSQSEAQLSATIKPHLNAFSVDSWPDLLGFLYTSPRNCVTSSCFGTRPIAAVRGYGYGVVRSLNLVQWYTLLHGCSGIVLLFVCAVVYDQQFFCLVVHFHNVNVNDSMFGPLLRWCCFKL